MPLTHWDTIMTEPYTQSDHDRATEMGGKMIAAAALIALLALILAVIS